METITKQKLLDLKYEEVGDTMRKKYPEKAQPGEEIGIVIFRKEPNSDSYIFDNKFLMLFYYKRSWDANDFLSDILTAMVQYREDMRALGFETEGGDPTADDTVKNPFQSIGYAEIPESVIDSIEHSKELASRWDPDITDAENFFSKNAWLAFAPKIDTSNVTNMSGMFQECPALTSVPAFDTSNVASMIEMFYECSGLTSVPLFDTSKVIDMSGMFAECSGLTSVPAFNTSNVTDMSEMFYGCSGLTSILMTNTKCSFDITDTKLEHDALVTLLNNLGTANSGATLTMGNAKLMLLSNAEKKIALDKGWTLEREILY